MSIFITGGAGCGKTTELVQRVHDAAQNARVLVTAPNTSSLDALHSSLSARNVEIRSLTELAMDYTGEAELIEDAAAALLFAQMAEPLLNLSWTEFIEAELDPEVPALRAPERFLEAAFRLICKLRDAHISPEQFLESSLRGAAQFYAKPPNLAHPDLLYYTKDSYRDSLDVDAAELGRQYRRELDLAKILAKLYRAYLDHPVRAGCLTPRDAIAQATQALRADSRLSQHVRVRYAQAFVDDAHDLTLGELHLLQAVYGERLDGVTLAGNPDSATSVFRGARPDRVFAVTGERIVLDEQRRSPFAVDAACRHLLGAPGPSLVSTDSGASVTLFRASTQRAEAQFIAEHVIDLLRSGAGHDDIALVFRSVANVRPYRDALLARGVDVQVCGDLDLFSEPEALDALAILWILHDPFRHDFLLRVLSGPAFALSDASLAVLCAHPPETQTPLFTELPSGEPNNGRWDAKRDVRLAWNVLHGDCDAQLGADARERVQTFRAMRARWVQALRSHEIPDLMRLVWSQGLARAQSSAAAAYQQHTLSRMHARAVHFARSHPDGSLAEFLGRLQTQMDNGFSSREIDERSGCVRLLDLDAAKGRQFDHVIVPNARAGAFPCWYVPDAFLYSPSLGMIAKENVGDARAARTAKFTYYMFRTKAREAYNLQERRAFVYALRRARSSALVTASERATRGVAAPEFLAELQAARLPGVIDRSDRWRPARTTYS